MTLWRVILLLALWFAPTLAHAHVRSESHSVWEINGSHIDLVLTVPVIELKRLTQNGAAPTDAQAIGYLAGRVFPLAKGVRCPLTPPVQALGGAPGYRRYDFTFRCASADDIQIHAVAFLDRVRSHTNFAQIQNATTGEFTEQLITADNPTVDVTGGEAGRLKTARLIDFVAMGVMHIFTGVDHMSFLLGLILISRRLKDLVFVVSGFTLGHSLTLALAVTGVIRPHAEYIDALVALTIALIGLENIAAQTHKPAPFALAVAVVLGLMAFARVMGFGALPVLLLLGAGLFTANYLMVSGRLQDVGRLRLVITLVFGLVHGFGFAADLLTMQLPPERLAELLVGFNLGVEIGQLILVAGVTLLVMGLRRLHWTLPRPIVVDVAASSLVGLGAYWFISRSF
jgi:hypothetical protein